MVAAVCVESVRSAWQPAWWQGVHTLVQHHHTQSSLRDKNTKVRTSQLPRSDLGLRVLPLVFTVSPPEVYAIWQAVPQLAWSLCTFDLISSFYTVRCTLPEGVHILLFGIPNTFAQGVQSSLRSDLINEVLLVVFCRVGVRSYPEVPFFLCTLVHCVSFSTLCACMYTCLCMCMCVSMSMKVGGWGQMSSLWHATFFSETGSLPS